MLRSVVVGLLGLLLSGCVANQAYAPHSLYPVDQDFAELHAHFQSAASISGYYAGADTVARRNEFIAGRLTLHDLEYLQFVKRFRLSHAQERACSTSPNSASA